MKIIKKHIINLWLVVLLAALNPLFGLEYKIYDLGHGKISSDPWESGLDPNTFILNNRGEVLKYEVYNEKSNSNLMFSIYHRFDSNKFVIPELANKDVRILSFKNGFIVGTFRCNIACDTHYGEKRYSNNRHHLFSYDYDSQIFIDLTLEAEKCGFTLNLKRYDWSFTGIDANDNGVIVGEFLDKTNENLFYYSPKIGLKKIHVEDLKSTTTHKLHSINKEGQVLFSTEYFDEVLDDCINQGFYYYDPVSGITKLEKLSQFLDNKKHLKIHGINGHGDIFFNACNVNAYNVMEDFLYNYNIYSENLIQIHDYDYVKNISFSNNHKSCFNTNGKAVIHTFEENEEKTSSKLLVWDPSLGLSTHSLPQPFTKYIDWHGINVAGSLLGSIDDHKAFIWNECFGIIWLKDMLTLSEQRELVDKIDVVSMTEYGDIIAEYYSDIDDKTHVIILSPVRY